MACTTLKHASSSTPYFVQPGPSPIASPKAPGQAKISALGMVKVVSADAVLSTAGGLGNVALRERSWEGKSGKCGETQSGVWHSDIPAYKSQAH